MDDLKEEMLKFWRSSWEGQLMTLTALSEQGDKILELLYKQDDVALEESKNLIKEWLAKVKEAQRAYSHDVEEGIKRIEELLSSK